jgi:hypothetical protein
MRRQSNGHTRPKSKDSNRFHPPDSGFVGLHRSQSMISHYYLALAYLIFWRYALACVLWTLIRQFNTGTKT